MTVKITLPQFEGPFELLLKLIEEQQLTITEVALADVAEQYLAYIHSHEEIPLFELADFLYVAARLLHLKSKVLVPDVEVEEEEEIGMPLEHRLRMYKAYAEATHHLEDFIKKGNVAFFGKVKAPPLPPGFYPPTTLTSETLAHAMSGILARIAPLLALPKVRMEKVVSINEKIEHIKTKILNTVKLHFHEITDRSSTSDTIVSFLALLELIKTRHIKVDQGNLFEDIFIEPYESNNNN